MYMYNACVYVYVYMYMYILMCVAVSPAPSGREGPDLSNFKEGVSNLGTKVQSDIPYKCKYMCMWLICTCNSRKTDTPRKKQYSPA